MSSNVDANEEADGADFTLQNRLIAVLHLMPVLKESGRPDANATNAHVHIYSKTERFK
jgi:hypothetical protein